MRFSRRKFLKVGVSGALALSVPAFAKKRRKHSVIFLYMAGGPSHLDTFDPKPNAGIEFAGPFKSIPTNVDGVEICEHLPRLAKMMDRMALVRSMSSGETNHERARHLLQTGQPPCATLESHCHGEVIALERGQRHVRLNHNEFHQNCLEAVHLVQDGVDFVTVTMHGWDTHHANFETLSQRLLPTIDNAISVILDDLGRRGLWDTTLVVWSGEFGRTPRINTNAKPGRDHWANAWTVMLAGCGVKGGTVIGSTDDFGMRPVGAPLEPANLTATIYDCMGVDYRKYVSAEPIAGLM